MCKNEARFVPPHHLLGGTNTFNDDPCNTCTDMCILVAPLQLIDIPHYFEYFTMDVMCMDMQSNMFTWQ